MQDQIPARLTLLRAEMQHHQLDYYLIPSADPHQNEYVPPCWDRRVFISGFTGSAGTALVGLEKAYLWTDGRYFLQAERELDLDHYQLMKMGIDPTFFEFLAKQKGQLRVGVDPCLLTQAEASVLTASVTQHGGEVIWLNDNLVDLIWSDQPAAPKEPAWVYTSEFAGLEAGDKIQLIRKKMRRKGCQNLSINRCDSIAWLLNIRGNDVAYNPLCISYLILTLDTVWWFVDPIKVKHEMTQYLASLGIVTKPYKAYFEVLKTLSGATWLDTESASYANCLALKHSQTIEALCPVYAEKAIKNPAEMDGARHAHLLDGLALCEFFHWLESKGAGQVTECEAVKRLHEAREVHPEFKQDSFAAISGYAEHGAIIHYHSTDSSDVLIGDDSIYLLDSGGQYLGGTTDVTRCIHLGEPTPQQCLHYTLVLKAHLALKTSVFPLGTTGEHLDIITRQPLWRRGLDFAHGTGHGVGSFLCVHEGPQRIGRGSSIALQKGMIVSNEPGLYLAGKYGIRIENLCLIAEYVPPSDHLNIELLGLLDLTLYPYEQKLIDQSLLSIDEVRAVNHYHAMVYNQLSPRIESEERLQWLAEKTYPLELPRQRTETVLQ